MRLCSWIAAGLLAASAGIADAKPGVDFISDAKALYHVAACGDEASTAPETVTHGDTKLADKIDKIVAAHCKVIHKYMDGFKDTYFVKGREWFDGVVPKTAPKTVVYPFGGGDLISALVAFPDATEITTISLELAGDPRRIEKLTPDQIDNSLGALRSEIGGLVSVGSNTSTNLSASQRNELPGQVSSFLLGLVAGGYEPVSMRYFTIDSSGDIKYVEQADIDAADADIKHHDKSLKSDWSSPNFSALFSNVEIEYRKIGDTQIRVHRHIGWNLGDKYMKDHPELLRHLEKKGKVTMLTKGGSYLLWRDDFSQIRGYMLDHLAWMLSDSTGISPGFAKAANMEQETYGSYSGAFLEGARGGASDKQFVALWASQPRRKLPFRFGYVDMDGAAHLVVTRPKP
nr:hypothetical protein [Kofleriaceae bacterium]